MYFRFTYLLIFLFNCYGIQAQNIFKTKRTITSTLTKIIAGTVTSEAKIDTTVTSDEQTVITTSGGRDSGESIFLVKREVKILPKKENTVLEFNIKRIKQKNNFLDVDTDNPFSNSFRNKSVTEHFQKNLDNRKQLLVEDGEVIERFDGNLGPWDSYFPKLYPIEELSGFIVKMPEKLHIRAWIDSLYSDRYLYVTNYEVTEQNEQNVQLSITGYLRPLKPSENIKPPTVDINKLSEGSSVQVDVKILRMQYQGKLTIDPSTGIIQRGEITIDKDYLMVGGFSKSKFPTTTLSVYTIENEVK